MIIFYLYYKLTRPLSGRIALRYVDASKADNKNILVWGISGLFSLLKIECLIVYLKIILILDGFS